MWSFLTSLFTTDPYTKIRNTFKSGSIEDVTRQLPLLDLHAEGTTPAHLMAAAIEGDNLPVFKYHLAKFKDDETFTRWETTWKAAQAATKNLKYFKLLWEADPSISTVEFNHIGNTAGFAIVSDQTDVVAFLLEKGLDPNSPEFAYHPAIENAAGNGNLEIVRMLLDYGANVKETNALARAQCLGHIEMLKLLVQKGGMDINGPQKRWVDFTGYEPADEDDNDEAPDTEEEEAAQKSPVLHLAVAKGQIEVVRALLFDLKADATLTDGKGRTALQRAQKKGNKKILQLLAQAQKS